MLKSKLEKMGLSVEIREYSPDTMEWFLKHQIKTVPRLVIEDGERAEIIQGIDDIINELKKND